MAKTTSTTKAKTKTTKRKPTVKAATKTTMASAKVKKSAAITAKPVVAKHDTKVTIRIVESRFAFLRRVQVRLGLLFTALAVAAGLLMNNESAQVLMGHLAKDELASRAGTVLAPAAHVLYEVEFRWLLVATLAVAAVLALLRGTRYFAREQAGMKRRVQTLRWVDFAITNVLMFEIVALLNGLQDAAGLKLAMVFVALAAYFAWMFERENAATGKPARATYRAAQVAVAVPVLALVLTMLATYVYGMERSPWYAYAAAAVVATGLLATIRAQWNAYKLRNGSHDYPAVDRTYTVINSLTKVSLAVVLIIGLYAQ